MQTTRQITLGDEDLCSMSFTFKNHREGFQTFKSELESFGDSI